MSTPRTLEEIVRDYETGQTTPIDALIREAEAAGYARGVEAMRAMLTDVERAAGEVLGDLFAEMRAELPAPSAPSTASAATGEGRAGPTMAMLLDGFDAEIERRSAQLSAPKGGQSVSPSGDFVSAVPSVLHALRWWSRAFREALPAPPPAEDKGPTAHWSSCAVNNGPAFPAGPCDCGGYVEGATPPTPAHRIGAPASSKEGGRHE